ncbi:MAG TPA: hypothetical protein PLP42_14735 [Acidobacteriota bacterium]|nr:hypothetical protein [Acidobacteriota bacterium]
MDFRARTFRSRTPTLIPVCLLFCSLVCTAGQSRAGNPPGSSLYTDVTKQEEFLKTARIVKARAAKGGVTGTTRATLRDGAFEHDVSIQCIDLRRTIYQTRDWTELNFKDSYKFNIAAYRLARLLGLNNVPPSVERSYLGKKASFTWWINDVILDERQRQERKIEPPDVVDWNQQIQIVRVFDHLIQNTDRNQGNLLITKDWKIWMIDHSRAFRTSQELKKTDALDRCDRRLLASLKRVELQALKKELGRYLTGPEMTALLTRRDLIVKHFDRLGKAALYDLKRSGVHVDPSVAQAIVAE